MTASRPPRPTAEPRIRDARQRFARRLRTPWLLASWRHLRIPLVLLVLYLAIKPVLAALSARHGFGSPDGLSITYLAVAALTLLLRVLLLVVVPAVLAYRLVAGSVRYLLRQPDSSPQPAAEAGRTHSPPDRPAHATTRPRSARYQPSAPPRQATAPTPHPDRDRSDSHRDASAASPPRIRTATEQQRDRGPPAPDPGGPISTSPSSQSIST